MKSIFLLLVAGTLTCRAWGPEGHEIVGRIAEKHLTPEAARGVRGLTTNSLSEISNWPDEIRRARPETAPWHYVDIPYGAEKLDVERDCVAHTGCVVTAIERFTHVVADRQTNVEARVEALKFLVHFVGDIHTPLHCAERNGDQGGNLVWVRWPGDEKASKLHAVWDVHFVSKNIRDAGLSAITYADKLAENSEKLSATGTAADWAWESHRLAVERVYPGVPPRGRAWPVPAEYIQKNQPVVAQQLTKAGLRLACLLNEVFRP